MREAAHTAQFSLEAWEVLFELINHYIVVGCVIRNDGKNLRGYISMIDCLVTGDTHPIVNAIHLQTVDDLYG